MTAPSADITQEAPAFADVPFPADTGYVPLSAGNYDVSVTPAGDNSTVAIFAFIAVVDGGVDTAVARDAPGGGMLALITLDDAF